MVGSSAEVVIKLCIDLVGTQQSFSWMCLIVLLMLSCVDCTGTQLFTWQCLVVMLIWSPFCWPMELM